ncbi:glycerol kinase GlpK [Rhizobium sp. A37_96]
MCVSRTGFVMAIDQGTTSSRAIVFDAGMQVVSSAQREINQIYPQPGWVEHDPIDIWESVSATIREASSAGGISPGQIASIGITNQRETVVVWDRKTGLPLYNAIVWQDRRTADACARLKADGIEEAIITPKTGLLLDPYFSATKLAWLLANVDGLRARATAGEVCFGTVDSWLIYKLTGGRRHVTDVTNASRTLLFDIEKCEWDESLQTLFGIPTSMLPEVLENSDDFGHTDPAVVGATIPINGVAGDQQSAVIGNACFEPGMIKSTYGTGCFALLNTGQERVSSTNRMLTTVAYKLKGKVTYALEGSIFVAGAAVQWLRDELGIITTASEIGPLAASADPSQAIFVVPAFVGLGAPYWDPDARGAIFGLTRNTGRAELARAVLESVALQTQDLVAAMTNDWTRHAAISRIRVDGGMAASDWTMQRVADIVGMPVERPALIETTALGAAWLAGFRSGVWPGAAEFEKSWARDGIFTPSLSEQSREAKIRGWRDAVSRTLSRPMGGHMV